MVYVIENVPGVITTVATVAFGVATSLLSFVRAPGFFNPKALQNSYIYTARRCNLSGGEIHAPSFPPLALRLLSTFAANTIPPCPTLLLLHPRCSQSASPTRQSSKGREVSLHPLSRMTARLLRCILAHKRRLLKTLRANSGTTCYLIEREIPNHCRWAHTRCKGFLP